MGYQASKNAKSFLGVQLQNSNFWKNKNYRTFFGHMCSFHCSLPRHCFLKGPEWRIIMGEKRLRVLFQFNTAEEYYDGGVAPLCLYTGKEEQ